MNASSFVFLTLVFIAGCVPASDTQPRKVTGTLVEHKAFPSAFVDARQVDVWLPAGYGTDTAKRYTVLYMHDGQNLFDSATSYIGVDWGMDETMTSLIAADSVQETVVVGVWNTANRTGEYMPQKAFDLLPDTAQARLRRERNTAAVVSDAYLQFLVKELKPFIDSTYRTKPDRAHTFVMGSSMGGLISLYAVCEYPDVYGGAGCVSTHFPAGDGVMIEYLKSHLPPPGSHRIYFDFGTETLDKQYEPYQRKADAAMQAAGFTEGKNWTTKKFEGDDHSERAWKRRVSVPLQFLLSR